MCIAAINTHIPSLHFLILFFRKRTMTWNTLTTINDHNQGAAGRASVHWATQAPSRQCCFVFKGTIKLQRFGESELFRIFCKGRYYNRSGPVIAICDNNTLNTVTLPLPAEHQCQWSLHSSDKTCSDGTKVKTISFHFTGNNDGIRRIHINIPYTEAGGDGNLVGAFHFANQTHTEYQLIPDNFLLEDSSDEEEE